MSLEGWVPVIGEGVTLAEVIERAFDYRGNVTVVRTDGSEIVGYVFNRNVDVPEPFIQIFDQAGNGPLKIAYAEIRNIKFTGKDMGAGKSWAAWMERKEREKAERVVPTGTSIGLVLTGVEFEARALARALRLSPANGARPARLWSRATEGGPTVFLTVASRDPGSLEGTLPERPWFLLVVGLAGGLAPDVRSGCLVVGAQVMDEQGAVWHSDPQLLERARRCLSRLGLPHQVGPLVTRDQIVSTPGAKTALWRDTGALAVDMESASLLAEAHRREIPALAVRAIADGPSMALDPIWLQLITSRGALDSGRLAKMLLGRPSLLIQAARLGWASRRALSQLGRFLPAFLGEADQRA